MACPRIGGPILVRPAPLLSCFDETDTYIAVTSESLALESEDALFPFLHYLTANPSFPLKTTLTSTYLSRSAINPILTPYLLPNETYTLLEERLDKSMLLRDRGMRDLLRLGLAQREGSVRLEGMRRVWSEREKELNDSRDECDSWAEIGGKKVCSVDEFWTAVGNKEGTEPLTWRGRYVKGRAWLEYN